MDTIFSDKIKTTPTLSELVQTVSDRALSLISDVKRAMINQNTFNGITDIEDMLINYFKDSNIITMNIVSYIISNINQTVLINAKKQYYNKLDITLRTNKKNKLTISTICGDLTYDRYVIRPKTTEDYNKLKALSGVTSFTPLDDFLQISPLPKKMTAKAMLEVTKWAQNQSSYAETENVVKNVMGINFCANTIMAIANIVGRIVFDNDTLRAEEKYDQLLKAQISFPRNKQPGVLYIETDGAMVNTRDADNKGSSWVENKLAEIFSSNDIQTKKKANGEIYHRILKKEYTSYIGAAEVFKKYLWSAALRNGYGNYEDTVLLSDGATWIRNMKEELFPDAQQILDFYHLKEKLYDFSKIYFNDDKNKYKPWVKKLSDYFLDGKYLLSIKLITKMYNSFNNNDNIYNLVNYLENNIKNIDYKLYKEKGYFIGSGSIESSNKTVLQHRLKLAGMRWTKDGAQNMVTLRSKYLSGLWKSDVELPVLKYFNKK